MMCHNDFLLKLCLSMHLWTFSYASIIELNETTFASLPPLYQLDTWAKCRRPGDVYCMVDAALTAAGPSVTLQLLQEYSNQTLKHYNRTVIHRGVCVTRCEAATGNTDSWHSAAQGCINQTLVSYGLEAQVLSVDWCSVADSPPNGRSGRVLAVLCIVLVVLVFLATCLNVLEDHCSKIDGNKYLLAFSLKRNWAILTYDRSKPKTDQRMKDVACMEGIRFIGNQCVIFSHVLFVYVYSYIDNPQFVEKMYDQFGWQATLNSPIWLQSFFALSGFLTTYTVLITTESKPLTLFQCFLSIINRWIRLTPVATFALWFTISWYPLLGSGPQWAWLVQREADDCAERWWYHVVYVHNHLPLGKFCMGHTWYLAVDMQLHIFGILLLYVLVRCRKTVAPVLFILMVATSLAAGLVVYWYQLMPIITAQAPEALRSLLRKATLVPLLYLPVWMNAAGYVAGIAVAFVLHHNQLQGIKLNQSKLFNLVFHLALPVGGGVVVTGVLFLADSPPPLWAAAVYAAFDRTIVAVCFAVFMLGCFSRCRSALRSLLLWRGFHALGRLSYCAFLVHFIVLRLTLASNTQLGHASIYSFASLFITASVFTYIVSVPLCLLIELPCLQLWKALTERDKSSDRAHHHQSMTPPQVLPVKPFDLVAHVRRHEV